VNDAQEEPGLSLEIDGERLGIGIWIDATYHDVPARPETQRTKV